jgi:hypothetical protein
MWAPGIPHEARDALGEQPVVRPVRIPPGSGVAVVEADEDSVALVRPRPVSPNRVLDGSRPNSSVNWIQPFRVGMAPAPSGSWTPKM